MKFTNLTTDALLVLGVWVGPGEQTPDLSKEEAEGLTHQDIWEAEKATVKSKSEEK